MTVDEKQWAREFWDMVLQERLRDIDKRVIFAPLTWNRLRMPYHAKVLYLGIMDHNNHHTRWFTEPFREVGAMEIKIQLTDAWLFGEVPVRLFDVEASQKVFKALAEDELVERFKAVVDIEMGWPEGDERLQGGFLGNVDVINNHGRLRCAVHHDVERNLNEIRKGLTWARFKYLMVRDAVQRWTLYREDKNGVLWRARQDHMKRWLLERVGSTLEMMSHYKGDLDSCVTTGREYRSWTELKHEMIVIAQGEIGTWHPIEKVM